MLEVLRSLDGIITGGVNLRKEDEELAWESGVNLIVSSKPQLFQEDFELMKATLVERLWQHGMRYTHACRRMERWCRGDETP